LVTYALEALIRLAGVACPREVAQEQGRKIRSHFATWILLSPELSNSSANHYSLIIIRAGELSLHLAVCMSGFRVIKPSLFSPMAFLLRLN
jgi:hypothetical protein